MGKLKVVSPDFALPWFSIQWLQVIGHQIIKMWNVDPFPSFFGLVLLSSYLTLGSSIELRKRCASSWHWLQRKAT